MNTYEKHSRKPHNIKLFSNLKNWIKGHKKTSWVICAIIALCLGGGSTYLVLSNQPTDAKQTAHKKTNIKAPEPIKYYSPLTGVEVANQALTTGPVTGVMIENSPEARPQSGMKNSGVVFEAICEGGITRFLVLYQSEKPTLIGPVRSVRMYFLSWAAGFQAGVAHVGGNMDVMAEISNGNYRNLDEFAYADTFWRSEERWAPHNMYTNSANLDALNAALGYTTSDFVPFKREEIKKPTAKPTTTTTSTTSTDTTTNADGTTTAPAGPPAANSISIGISGPLFDSTYTYNVTTNNYSRFQAGEAHNDNEDGQITPSVVIAMRVDEYSSSEPENHEEITVIGSGAATIFQNGVAIEATWTKPSQFENLKFTDATGAEIPLVRGQTWIVAVPNSYGSVSYS